MRLEEQECIPTRYEFITSLRFLTYYQIDGTNFQAESIFTRLKAGQYTWTIRDSQGCRYAHISRIREPAGKFFECLRNMHIHSVS